MSIKIGRIGRWAVVLGLSAAWLGEGEVARAVDPAGRVVLAAQKSAAKKKGAAAKKGTSKGDNDGMGMAPTDSAKGAPAGGDLSFKRDIAPILVANCVGCHSGGGAGVTRGKYDMTTFEKLMAGGKRGKDIIPGEPDTSHLVLMTKGEETPRMPPRNGQTGLAEGAAAKLEAWIKAGAVLDAGIARTEPLSKYALTVADLRQAEIDKMKPEERDKVAEQAGRDRWKKSTRVEPEATVGAHFLLLGNLPKPRAADLLKKMEAQYTQANKILATAKGPALAGTEKIGLYVFKDSSAYVEFVRGVENQEVEAGEAARARLDVESPYIVAVDPAAGGEEAAFSAPKKAARGKKKADESAAGPERTLAGLLTEQLVAAAANKAGKPPKWVSLGLGAFSASQVEAGSPYYRRLRAETAENVRIGWQVKGVEALGGEGKVETVRAAGYSLFEWMAGNWPAPAVNKFIRAMLEGQDKLDEALGNCLDITREQFLAGSEMWFHDRYGVRR